MIATTLHSIAVGNLLPAWVKVVCVDINPSTVIKLSDRGTFQTVGLVTDVEPFLRALVQEVERLNGRIVMYSCRGSVVSAKSELLRPADDDSSPGEGRCRVDSAAPHPDVSARLSTGSSTRSIPG